jgi:hypothetical protein
MDLRVACPKVLIEPLLCAISVSSALWLTNIRENNHRDTEDREVAQRNQTFRAKPVEELKCEAHGFHG